MSKRFLAVLALVALTATACSSKSDPKSDPKSGPPPASAAGPAGKLPVTVRSTRYSWTVTKTETVTTTKDKDGLTHKPPGDAVSFFRVTMTVKNLTSGAQPYSVYDDHLNDAANAPWAASGFEIDGTYDQTLADFKAGEERAVVELFPLNDGTKPVSMVLGAFDANDSNGATAPLG